jgi:putative ABC transport system permease protein
VFLRTAAKIALRELRATPAKFLFVIMAVAVGVAALSGVKGFGYGFRGMLLHNAKQLIAADVQAQTWDDPTPQQEKQMDALGSANGGLTRVTETVSMAGPVVASGPRVPQMISVKAVDPAAYPYYGKLGLKPALPLKQLLANDDDAVVSDELLIRFKAHIGDSIRVGGKEFRITGEVTAEPDRLASGFGPGMRVMITRQGLERTGLMQFGSRAARRFLFRLKPGTNLDTFKQAIEHDFRRIYISDYREGSENVRKAIDNTTTFLSLISLIALILGSLGVAMAMYSHLQQRMDTIAVMKAVGGRAIQIIQVYLIQTLMLGLLGGVIGVAVGALVQKAFPILMQRVFSLLPEVGWDWSFSLQGIAVGVLATLLFTLPPLLSIRNVRPSLVFRRDMADDTGSRLSKWRDWLPVWSGVALIWAGFWGIAYWLSGSMQMAVYFVAGLTASIALLFGVAALVLSLLRLLVRKSGRILPSTFRHGFANLYRPGNQAKAVLVALGVGVMFTATTYLVQKTVLREVAAEGPGREGNLFLLDIRNTSAVTSMIESLPGVTGKVELVGYIVSRMTARNGVPTDQLKLSKQRKDQLQTVRITTANALPNGIKVQDGVWWSPLTIQPELAVSEEAQRDFNLKVGDRLRFLMAGKTVDAPLVAIFRRDRSAPVRYELVFPQGALKGMPVVYYGAAHVNPAYIPQVEESIFEKFPTVTVMNLADVLQRIQEAVDQVAVVIRFLALFAIVAGVIILSSSIAGTRYRRVREVAILKALGGTQRRIAGIFSVEFSLLGAVSGLIGGVLANVFTRIISDKFIDASFEFDAKSIVVSVIGTILVANLAGWLASAKILGQRPLEVLRGE